MEMFSAYLQLDDDCRLFYKVYGSSRGEKKEVDTDKPTLIFLPGGPGVVDLSLYVPFWSQFADDSLSCSFQVIFIDHRGTGRSCVEGKDGLPDYGKKENWNLEQWGQDVYTFFSRLKIKRPVLAGVSFGGVVAQSCAVQFPNSLSGLILCDTDAKFDVESVSAAFRKKALAAGSTVDEADEVANTARRMFNETTPETYNAYVKTCIPYCATKAYSSADLASCVKHEKVALHYNRNELTQFDYTKKLSQVNCPVLVLAGDQAPVHTEASAKITTQSFANGLATLGVFQGAGSPVYADQHDEVVITILEFLKNRVLVPSSSQAGERKNGSGM
jgi:pimeloyl-ACP methyl ester carboxylesterase